MASSKGSPGPHDRKDYGAPPPRCIKLTRLGKRCKRLATGKTKLCKTHEAMELEGLSGPEAARLGNEGGPEPTRSGMVRGAISTQVKKQSKAGLTAFVINQQAKDALRKLGDKGEHFDPKQTLLDTVHSAWRQRQVWEQMMAAIPDEDWADVGKPPIPGSQASSKGARIESIQRFLSEATKVAARVSKLAIDAGIEERLVRLAEEQSALIADTVRAGVIAGIGSLHLSPQAEKAAIEAALGSAATHLRLLAAGQVGEEGMIIDSIAQEVRAHG